jgi:hypothetical protein
MENDEVAISKIIITRKVYQKETMKKKCYQINVIHE